MEETKIEYHEGRPKIQPMKDRSTLITCPLGHFYHHVPRGEWAGSIWEAKVGDPSWSIGAQPEDEL